MTTSGYIAAIDQGTTSTRCIIFDRQGRIVARDALPHRQIMPRPGWVEHDALEIWENTRACTTAAMAKAELRASDIAAVGITNQRETTVAWDRNTGLPLCPAIVWQDTRTGEICAELAAAGGTQRYQARTGLPLATYFAGPKIRWILDNVPSARELADAGQLLVGTIDTWLLWNLTGGPSGGVHYTDVTNASRTMLMDLHTLAWDHQIAQDMDIPLSVLPEIRSSSDDFGTIRAGPLTGVTICGVLGDQQAATFGQACLSPGEAKNTYGTGNFILLNTGTTPVASTNGLLTTVCYRLAGQPPVYALEGSIAVSGSLVQWIRDNLGLIAQTEEIEPLAKSVADNGGCYVVPAFSGLFAPYWRPDARGAIVGLTRYVTKGHIARAVLEATAFQTREVLDAMNADAGLKLSTLKVDGGMVFNETLMQFQADILNIPVIRPMVAETTALGAAYAAGLAVDYWPDTEAIVENWHQDKQWLPQMATDVREREFRQWKKAVTKTFDWV